MNLKGFSINEARQLQGKLQHDENLSIVYAAILADNALNRFDDRVKEGVRLWMKGKLTDDFAVEDASIGEIREYVGLEGFQALCYMDIYLKSPDFIRYDVDWFERRFD